MSVRKSYSTNEKNILVSVLESWPTSSCLSDDEFTELINLIEKSCNNAAVLEAELTHTPAFWNYDKFRRIYCTICYRVNSNLDKNSSIENKYLGPGVINYMFRKRIRSKSLEEWVKFTGLKSPIISKLLNGIENSNCINPSNIGFMSSEELFPDINAPIHEQIDLRRKQKINYKTSSRYVCKNCKARKTRIEERQTKALDEPSTTFIICINCGSSWTKS